MNGMLCEVCGEDHPDMQAAWLCSMRHGEEIPGWPPAVNVYGTDEGASRG